jgi:hypothetical protein
LVSPAGLIGDKAYDSDDLADVLDDESIEQIAPHRKNRRPERDSKGHLARSLG